MLRLLTFTNLYPDAVRPRHGIFVEHRLRRLVATGEVAARVVAPLPWCPLPVDARYPEYRVTGVPSREQRSGIEVHRPRYWVVPGLTSNLNPWSMMRVAKPIIAKLIADGYDFDVLDAQFLFPDGMAGVMLARHFNKPVTLTARGSDVNVALQESGPRRWLQWALPHVDAFITVSAALKAALVDAGVPSERIEVIRNGVDLTLFAERDRDAMRERLGLSGPTLLSVGNLVEGKGHHIVIEALAQLPQCRLMIIGQGPELARLESLAETLRVAERVQFVAHVDQRELAEYYSAADITVLASSREGMANVLLESIACGTPVVATDVGGNPEVISHPNAGELIRERSSAAVTSAVQDVLQRKISRTATREYAAQFGWERPIATQLQLLRSIVDGRARARAA